MTFPDRRHSVIFGTEFVWAGGLANGDTIEDGGTQILSGGTGSGTLVSSGGVEFVSSGGIASATAVLSGGYEYVFTSGTDDDSIILGAQFVSSGGLADATTIGNGGSAFVSSGGVASATTVDPGGYETVSLGGMVSGGATLDGGTLDVQSGGIGGSSTITFAGSGTLELDAAQHYGMLVAGFDTTSDFLDFTAIKDGVLVYTGNTQSGTLTVSDFPGHSASIVLLGNYTALSFQLSYDSNGDTIVTDPPQIAGGSPFDLTTPHHG